LLHDIEALRHAAHDETSAIRHEADGLVETLQRFDQHAIQIGHDAERSLDHWQETLQLGDRTIRERQLAMVGDGHTILDGLLQNMKDTEHRINSFSHNAHQGLFKSASDTEYAVERICVENSRRIVDTISPKLGTGVSNTLSGMRGFLSAADQVGAQFNGGIGDAVSTVGQVAELLDEIKPVIELVRTLI
jgi:hypothetical protein